MRIIITNEGRGSPVKRLRRRVRSNPGVPDVHGAFSVEEFSYADDLKRTHEDAEGFLDYLETWHPRNFWYKDNGVKNWAFHETYDNWQETYGVDAVLAAYLSSHGSMGSDGNFRACMGANWSNNGHYAYSQDMRIGNEQANYVWWSTCESIRVKGGHDPIRTWSPTSLGFRMMFGYETTSVDDGDYGEDFWDEWNEGKPFSTAFLDASWGISSDQIPVVVAVGSTKNEARDRLYNEDMLDWGHVQDNWWWWRWYEKANPARRAPNHKLPEKPQIAILARPRMDSRHVKRVLQRHHIEMRLPNEVKANLRGTFFLKKGRKRVAFRRDGTYEVEFRRPTMTNTSSLGEEQALEIATDYVKRERLASKVDLEFDHIRYSRLNGGNKRTRRVRTPMTVETTVIFTQKVNGLPVISPKSGRMLISLDNDGKVTRLENRTRVVSGLTKHARSTYPAPDEELHLPQFEALRRLLKMEWEKRLKIRKAMGRKPSRLKIVPGTDEVGYVVAGNEMTLEARALVEVTMPSGFRKRYIVSRPLFA